MLFLWSKVVHYFTNKKSNVRNVSLSYLPSYASERKLVKLV